MKEFNGLQWTFTKEATKVVFMDLTISIVNGCILTTLYKKLLNLYLYIPTSLAHPPGVLSGLILGNINCFHQLCSNPKTPKLKQKSSTSVSVCEAKHMKSYNPFLKLASKPPQN